MNKKCSLEILPSSKNGTYEASTVGLANLKIVNEDVEKPNHIYFNLYVTSDEEIKEGDWYFDLYPEAPFGVGDMDINSVNCICKCNNPKSLDEGTYKIIASTDIRLNLPKLQYSFIEKYQDKYNEGNKIKEVLVEYEEEPTNDGNSEKYATIKVSEKGFIEVSTVKESYTKKEVEEILEDYRELAWRVGITKDHLKKFIESNL